MSRSQLHEVGETASVSAGRGLWLWSQERFPLGQGVVIAILYGATFQYAQRLQGTTLPLRTAPAILGFLACWSIFLLLRILDEHKDFEADLINHPKRVLQRGAVTLQQLRVVGVFSLAAPIAYCWVVDGGFGTVGILGLGVLSWAALMAVEFFLPQWLNRHLIVYGLSHLLIMPMLLGWLLVGSAPDPRSWQTLYPSGGWLLMLGLCAGCSYELTRKAWGKEEENPGIPSYSRILGHRGVALAIAGALLLSVVASTGMLARAGGETATTIPSVAWGLVPAGSWALTVATLIRYAQSPCSQARKRNESMVGLAMLLSYGTPLVVMSVS